MAGMENVKITLKEDKLMGHRLRKKNSNLTKQCLEYKSLGKVGRPKDAYKRNLNRKLKQMGNENEG